MARISKVIISGQRNTGKSTLYWLLQKELNWPCFSVSHFLLDYMRTNGLQGASFEKLAHHEEVMRREIDERVTALLSIPDKVIIETRIFESIKETYKDTLKILLTANDQTRIARNAFREQISIEKSAKRLIPKENKWLEKITQQFGFSDYFDPKYYDLVLDTSEMTKMEVLDTVVKMVQ